MNATDLRPYILLLCITDYLLTIIGIQTMYITEFNPIFYNFFKHHQYVLGLVYKIILTLMCVQIINILNKQILWYILCIYLSVNCVHIFYILLTIGLKIC